MAPIKITVKDRSGEANQEVIGDNDGFKAILDALDARFLRDDNGASVRSFGGLVRDGIYTRGPPVQQQSTASKNTARVFTVFVRNYNLSVKNVIKFHDKVLPSTVQDFWVQTGVDGEAYDFANVTVKMVNGWEKLSRNPKDTNYYVEGETGHGFMFQLSPLHTPASSPIKDDYSGITEQNESEFGDCIQKLFNNPFNASIPKLYKDDTLLHLQSFLRRKIKASSDPDVKVIAAIFAMPGAGKTRRIVGLPYYRYKMSNHRLYTTAQVQQFLRNAIAAICACDENQIPMTRKNTVLIHFDEVQSLMDAPTDTNDNSLVTSLAKECDALFNVSGRGQRLWLRFVMTGTNIFSNKSIAIGSAVKMELIPMEGSFSMDLVGQLVVEHGLEELLGSERQTYLERCRHNRRFTENYFFNLWWEANTGKHHDSSIIAKAYGRALDHMKHTIRGAIEQMELKVSQVACAVFSKILQSQESAIIDGVATLINCSSEQMSYIKGGGLNVKDIGDANEIDIFYPNGCVLELLEALLAGANSRHGCQTVLSFLRANHVLGFGIRGHLFEWLLVYDITSPRSESDEFMPKKRRRLLDCVGSEPKSCTKVYDHIAPHTPGHNTWVVLDEHNAHQNRWIDVAYSILPPRRVRCCIRHNGM